MRENQLQHVWVLIGRYKQFLSNSLVQSHPKAEWSKSMTEPTKKPINPTKTQKTRKKGIIFKLINCILQRKREMMMGGRLGERIGMREEVINRACSLAMKAHKSRGKHHYLYDKIKGSSEVVFAFAGSWSAHDWFPQKPFGATKINLSLFPSLRSIGTDETALVNEAFARRFEAILTSSSFMTEVEKAMKEKKQIVFAGHSSGGVMATLATLWFLEKFRPDGKQMPHRCVTFGSPLTGDRIFPHALRRENWASYFINFIMRYDIVPRIMLAPLSSIEKELQLILESFNPKSQLYKQGSVQKPTEASAFFKNVMTNASFVASHAACNLMGSTNLLLETVSSFVQLSPYRPFGKYIFCTGNGKLVVVENSDAVLQMLFYCSQLSCETEGAEVVVRSLNEHLAYENELQGSLEMQIVVYLDRLVEVPLSSNSSASGDIVEINTILIDLGLSTKARLCLRAAGELEKQKLKNQEKIDANESNIQERLKKIDDYQMKCSARRLDYYDTFKLQKENSDFEANVKRLELAGIWDEIIEMLKRHELPDEFEGRKKWIELGTRYRRLVEPLDIANFYRHLKNEDTGPYLKRGRPKRYRFTQRWLEHGERMAVGSSSESCFWAEVEELRISKKTFKDMEEDIVKLEKQVKKWVESKEISKDVFLEGSTFTKWWRTLPHQHQSASCIKEYIGN